jgi:hypothetical protein
MKARYVVGLLLAMLAASGCNSLRQVAGIPLTPEPTINIKSAETRWLLIKNPRFGDVRSEPEYIWVEEDKMPTTMTTLLRGKSAIIAPPEVVAKYGLPPGGGKISPRQGVPYQTDQARQATADPRAGGSAAPAPAPIAQLPLGTPPAQQAPQAAPATPAPAPAPAPAAAPAQQAPSAAVKAAPTPVAAAPVPVAAPEPPKRGYVVFVEPSRIVIDLTAVDGVRAGSVVSLRRDRIPLVHPVTGEVLGDLDDEVGTARITEIREKFSLAEVQSTAPGAEVQVRDRVIPK